MTKLGESLSELEAKWRALGCPTERHLRPGMPRDRVRAMLADAGLGCPDEVATWYSWHDGTVGLAFQYAPCGYVGLTLERSLSLRLELQEVAASAVASPYNDHLTATDLWGEDWLPLGDTAHGTSLAVTVGTPDLVADPVALSVNWEDPDFRDITNPLPALVQKWLEILDTGAFSWDATAERWDLEFDLVPVQLRGFLE